jgi:hypothetical protein
MDLTKEIEISKELHTEVGFDAEKMAVVLKVEYTGKHGFSKLENGVNLIEILQQVVDKTANTWDNTTLELIKTLITKLG